MTDRTPTSDPVAAARKRLTDGRVKTDNLSVPSIIETYANRLLDLHYDDADRASIVEERDDLLAWYVVSEAEARQQARAAFAAQVVAGAIAIHVNDGSSHDRAMAWSEGYSEGFAAASPEPANNALFIGADGAITDPNDDGRVVPAVTLDYESVWYHQGWERGYATAKAEVASPEPASPGSGLSEAFFDNVRIPDSNPVAQTPYGRGFNAAAQIIRDRLAARPDGALEAFPERVEVITAHRAVSHSTQRFREALAASPEPEPASPGSGLDSVMFVACEVCGKTDRVQMRPLWRNLVDEGNAIPIVGCGNPWHYHLDGAGADAG